MAEFQALMSKWGRPVHWIEIAMKGVDGSSEFYFENEYQSVMESHYRKNDVFHFHCVHLHCVQSLRAVAVSICTVCSHCVQSLFI